MNIRIATIQDSAGIINLWKTSNLLVHYNDPVEDIKQALSTPTSTLLAGEINENIAGTVMAGYDGHRGWIYYLAVKPEYQGNGYGRQLITAAEKWLKQQGAPKAHLLIRSNNTKVQSFYHTMGYEESDVIMMKKTL